MATNQYGISSKFKDFCSNLRMSENTVVNIESRARAITARVNNDFRGLDSAVRYRLYVGSYGRGTEIHTSDIDLIVELPYEECLRYDKYAGNGQSALMAALKNSIARTYSTTHLRADGQVVQISFSDGICYEILPAFINKDDDSFTYPDSNSGGSWKVTKPRKEIREINSANITWNKNLKRLCRMARAWKDTWNVPISGMLIDTLAYNFMSGWEYSDKSYMYYDFMTRDFFQYLKSRDGTQLYWLAPGSGQYVWRTGAFEHKALRCYNICLEALQYEEKEYIYSANQKWREIYGTKFPA